MTSVHTTLNALLDEVLRQEPSLRFEKHAPMAQYTTLHLGGDADLLAEPSSPEQLRLLLQTSSVMGVPVTVIGHGSDLVVLDGGIRGLVIRIGQEMRRITVRGDTIRAEAGAMMSALSMTAAEHSLGGLTFASGIPGTVGGGVYMNAGAYGGEMSQAVTRVEGFRMDGTPFAWTRPEMNFGYRASRLQTENAVAAVITCQLPRGDRDALLADMVELNRRRAEKQPLTVPSAGSTFKRPEGNYASALIEQCGLKGARVGGASVSEKHAGFLINQGGTASDFLALIALVRRTVRDKTGVTLEPEVRILGEETSAREV